MNITDQLARALAEAIAHENSLTRHTKEGWPSRAQPPWYADAVQALAAYSAQETEQNRVNY